MMWGSVPETVVLVASLIHSPAPQQPTIGVANSVVTTWMSMMMGMRAEKKASANRERRSNIEMYI
jgi:hypothetical protein